jgi:hypothetical protein
MRYVRMVRGGMPRVRPATLAGIAVLVAVGGGA